MGEIFLEALRCDNSDKNAKVLIH